jgi:phosphatidylinositol-3-phosphatase
MNKKFVRLCLLAMCLAGPLFAQEGSVPKGIPNLDHVFVIMMENHGYNQIFNNLNAPFINEWAQSAGLANNYFAVGHPSSTNYLEVVGGSNFGVRSDDYPDWHNASCTPNIIAPYYTTFDNSALNGPNTASVICPIWGKGMDAATPAFDCTNEPSPPITPISSTNMTNCYWDINGTGLPARSVVGKSIADQLFEKGKSWKSYQESLPAAGADEINISDGFFTNRTDFSPFIDDGSFSAWTPQAKDSTTLPPTPAVTVPAPTIAQASGDIVYLYAVKHNPFVYFASVQQGTAELNSLKNVVAFDGANGLYADLASDNVPNFSFIAPNQCNDMHGRGNAGPFCNFDANDSGVQEGLNETLILRGDMTVQRIVSAIKGSKSWQEGNNAIVLLWDENDYTATPNRVLMIVDTNYGHGDTVQSWNFYTHFSLLKSLEAGFGLPCLNHACDETVKTMTDLFGK